jgi:DNA-binding NarL/FixJ family response regulator
VPGFGPDGSVQFVLVISRDASEQQAAELERAQFYREVVAHQQQLTTMVAGLMKERKRDLSRSHSITQIERLTRHDRNILRLIARGWTNREIAAELGRSPGTVRNQVARILVKLDVSDRTQAAVRASELGLIVGSTE